MLRCVLACAVLVFGGSAFACTLPSGYEQALTPRTNAAQRELLPGPRVYLAELRRGFAASTGGNCADRGVVRFVIDPEDVSETDVWSFEAAEGSLPRNLLPRGYVKPVDLGSGNVGFMFTWQDLLPGARELRPLDATVRISRVAFSGDRSTPMLLRIEDPGGEPAGTRQSWNSLLIWVAAALVLIVFFTQRFGLRRKRRSSKDELAAIQARLRELADKKQTPGD